MQRLKMKDLQSSEMPASLPDSTALGVWKRSTGFEVVLPFHFSKYYWFVLFAGLVFLIAGSVLVYRTFPALANIGRTGFYFISGAIIIGYMGFMFIKLYGLRNTKIRMDLTRESMTLSKILPSGKRVPVDMIIIGKIDEIYISGGRGMFVDGHIPDPFYKKWFAVGLKASDLFYLALLVGQVSEMPQSVSAELLANL